MAEIALARSIPERLCCNLKRLSSFDYAQDGEPVEPYLANKDGPYALSGLCFTLHVMRDTVFGQF
ncbi:MAG: hypothetical protein BVN28_03205 [Nitrospira sp. ST-bin4]|jgi:hypothetical protein|nr:MAG: hypothetical protein BVN28_03205 [Nitrospira sp. ST-bin4]